MNSVPPTSNEAPATASAGSSPALARSLDDVRHLVVLGMPRSGTSLLMNILGEHPDVAMLDEEIHGAIKRLAGSKIRGVKLCVPNQINLERAWHPVNYLFHLNGMMRKSTLGRLRPRSRYSIRDYSRLNRVSFICLLRDPASTLDALKRRENLGLKVRRAMWHRFVEIMTAMKDERDWDVTFVSFESLVSEPDQQIGRLCERIDLPFHNRMLEAPKYNRRYPGRKFDAGKAGSKGIPDADELGLSTEALAQYQHLLEAAL